MWYRRHEAQRRYTFFFSSTTLAGAFGGLLASAIGKMDGMRGYAGWRWIFILEGTLTCVVSFLFFFILPVFPEDAKWLTQEEKAYVKARLYVDQGRSAAERQITKRDVLHVFKDLKVFVGGFMYFGLIVTAYGYAYFSPGIIQGYGYSPIQTQLHSVPPWAAAFGWSMLVAYFSDKARHRFGFVCLCLAVCIAGLAMLLGIHTNTHVEYGALFMVASGAYSAMPIIVCWFNMNLGKLSRTTYCDHSANSVAGGHHRRAVGSAWQIGFGNIGGIIAVYAYLKKDAPKYTPGYSISIAFACLSFIASLLYLVMCWHQNRKRERAATNVGLTEYEKTEMGDLNPDYRYQL